MIIQILSYISLLFSILISVKSILFFQHFFVLYKSKNSTSQFIQLNYKKFLVVLVGFTLSCVMIIFHIKGLVFSLESDSNNENNTNVKEHKSSYKVVIGKIRFHDEVINDEQIIWEHLFCKELLYDKYLSWSKETVVFDELRKLYQNDFCSMEELSNTTLDELSKHINSYYGSEILPATDKSLEEVKREIPPLDVRQNADAELFQNEFFLRAERCNTNSSAQCLYQIGRAADDAFKILSREHDISLKKMIFYGSMSVAFYLASMKVYDGSIDLVHVYYRIAEIYLYFEDYIDIIKENSAYSRHCLLMAERFLMLAQDEFKNKNKNVDIHETLPYFSYYYAKILDKYIRKYSKNEELITMCSKYTNDYLASPCSNKYTACRKSCYDILERLEKQE